MTAQKLLFDHAKRYPWRVLAAIGLGFSGAIFNGVGTTLIVPAVFELLGTGENTGAIALPPLLARVIAPLVGLPGSGRAVTMLGVIVLTILLKNLANYLSSVTSESLTRRLTCDLRRAGLDLLLGVDIDYHNTMRTGDIAKAALQQRVPVVFECHHHLDKRFDPEMATHPLLQAVVTVVDTVKESIVRSGMAEKKVVTIPNGFNGQFLARHPVAAQGWRDRLLTPVFTRLVVYAGALHEFKGVDLLLAIAPQFPQVKFSLAGGPGEQQRHYRQRIIDLGLENVELLGFLEQQDLAHLLQAADALAHPHGLGPAATFTSPLKLFDYLAAGTPVVATRIPSLDHWPLPAQSRPPPPRRSTVTLLPHSQAAQPPQVT